jgi:hypothetical protein
MMGDTLTTKALIAALRASTVAAMSGCGAGAAAVKPSASARRPTWRIDQASPRREIAEPLPSGSWPTCYLSTAHVISYPGHWAVPAAAAEASRPCST